MDTRCLSGRTNFCDLIYGICRKSCGLCSVDARVFGVAGNSCGRLASRYCGSCCCHRVYWFNDGSGAKQRKENVGLFFNQSRWLYLGWRRSRIAQRWRWFVVINGIFGHLYSFGDGVVCHHSDNCRCVRCGNVTGCF